MGFTIPKKPSAVSISSKGSFSIPKKASATIHDKGKTEVKATSKVTGGVDRLMQAWQAVKQTAKTAQVDPAGIKPAVRALTEVSLLKVSAAQLQQHSTVVQEMKALKTHRCKEIKELAAHILSGWRKLVEKGLDASSAAYVAPPKPAAAASTAAAAPASTSTHTPSSASSSKPSSSSVSKSKDAKGHLPPSKLREEARVPRADLPLGAQSTKDLKWVNGGWVNIKDPKAHLKAVQNTTTTTTTKQSSSSRDTVSAQPSSSASDPRQHSDRHISDSRRHNKRQLPPGLDSDQEDLDEYEQDEYEEDEYEDDFINDEEDDYEKARRMLREITGYNPSKYKDEDFDDRSMVASYDQISAEEMQSKRLGAQFDKEEEERERQRKEEKLRRKQMHAKRLKSR